MLDSNFRFFRGSKNIYADRVASTEYIDEVAIAQDADDSKAKTMIFEMVVPPLLAKVLLSLLLPFVYCLNFRLERIFVWKREKV